ncbi:TPA: oligosaccharide flippase family protein [Streptococcus suis]
MSEINNQRQEKMVHGAIWITAGNIISRLLGIIYIIPWLIWMGEYKSEANALFSMGYQVYANFLSFSTIGIPTAVAKQITQYNAKGRQDISYYLVREFLKFMLVMGALSAVLMFVSSPFLAAASGEPTNLIPIMYSLVPPLFIFPAMSIIRGFFQGYHDMRPFAISMIVEQIVRVVWILSTTYAIMKMGSGNYLDAVTQSTFAAFVGMIASVIVLVIELQKSGHLQKILQKKPTSVEVNIKVLIIETLKEAVPIIILGMIIQLYQFVDQLTFINTMKQFTDLTGERLLTLYSYLVANPSKITMLIIGIANSISGVAFLLITESYIQKDFKETARLISSNLQMMFIFVTPVILGSVLLAEPLYTIFYGQSEDVAIHLFVANLLLIFLQGLYAVFGIAIQAVFQKKKGLIYFGIGFGVKLLLQIPSIYLFQVYGSLISTAIGLAVTLVLFYRCIHQAVPFDIESLKENNSSIIWISLLMGVCVWVVEFFLKGILPVTGYFSSFVHIMISGSVGGLIFIVLGLKTRQLDLLIGERAQTLRQKLHL